VANCIHRTRPLPMETNGKLVGKRDTRDDGNEGVGCSGIFTEVMNKPN